jgi:transcriptional regulator with XRE-family HTH domain
MADSTDDVLVPFGQQVRERRSALGLSQERFAAMCGLDRTYLSGVERGVRNLSLRNVFAIATAFKCPMAALFDSDVAPAAGERSLLDMFGVDLTFLTQVVQANPSLRGVVIGYLAERKLWELFAADPRITAIRKDDDHDRENKGDLVVTYRGRDFRFEVKSLQTNSIRMWNPATERWMPKVVKTPAPSAAASRRRRNRWVECELYRAEWRTGGAAGKYTGAVQCDASDNREITLPNGNRVKTTNLKVGEFDVLALGLFAFRERWDFGFLLNRDLPRTTSNKYSPADRQYLLKTLVPAAWPLPPGCHPDPFPLLDRLIEEIRRT